LSTTNSNAQWEFITPIACHQRKSEFRVSAANKRCSFDDDADTTIISGRHCSMGCIAISSSFLQLQYRTVGDACFCNLTIRSHNPPPAAAAAAAAAHRGSDDSGLLAAFRAASDLHDWDISSSRKKTEQT
jgi:hypothetical protein